MLDFLNMIGNYEQRKVVNTVVGDAMIDTCRVTDSVHPFETGIESPLYNKGNWVIVECYDTEQEAREGHNRWIEVMKSPPRFLTDVINSREVQQIAEIFNVDLHKTFQKEELLESGES